MRRLFWLGLGAAAGVFLARKVSRAARAYTPHGIAASARQITVAALDSVRSFVKDVREGMADREAEIYAALRARELTADITDITTSQTAHMRKGDHR